MEALRHLLDGLYTTNDAVGRYRILDGWLRPLPLGRQLRMLRLLSGFVPPRMVQRTTMLQWAREMAAIPDWLFDASADAAGDAAETAALLCHGLDGPSPLDAVEVLDTIAGLAGAGADERHATVVALWAASNAATGRLVNRLLLGTFRPLVDRAAVVAAFAALHDVDADVLSWRCRKDWPAEADTSIVAPATADELRRLRWWPMPLLRQTDLAPDHRHVDTTTLVTWYEAGERYQWHVGPGEGALRTDGGTLVVDHPLLTPERATACAVDAVVDVLLPRHAPAGQQPVVVLDILAYDGTDYRDRPADERQRALPSILAMLGHPAVGAMPVPRGVLLLALARTRRADGLLIRPRSAPYDADHPWQVGVFPALVIRTVLYYAHRRPGSGSPRYGEYGLAVRTHDGSYVTVTRLVADVSPETASIVDDVVAATIVQRAGPVHTVVPQMVFEIACSAIKHSRRHKSGFVLTEPRLVALRPDLGPNDVHTVADLAAWSDPAEA